MRNTLLRETALAFALGAMAALGQAPWGLWFLSVPAFAALIWCVTTSGRPTLSAWLGGAGYFAVALSWIVEPFLIDAETYAWMAPFALFMMAFGLALFWAAAGYAGSRARRHPALAFALALTLAELARGYVLTGFPWATPGHIWIGTPLDQAAAYVGPNGLTLLTLLAASLPVAAYWRGTIAGLGLLGLVAAGGAWRLSIPLPPDRPSTLRLVQPNAEQRLKWDASRARTYLDSQLAMTAKAPVADLTIWPETAIPYLFEDSPEVASLITDASGGRPVALGIQRVEGQRFWNSLRVVQDAGDIVQTYDKYHLVPFGEYVPFGDLAQDWFGLTAFAARSGNSYSPGQGAAVLDLGPALGKVLPLICYEAVFPQDLRAAPERADWILQITNDAWFGIRSGPFQHAAQAALRATEQGLPLIRVANTGITQVIDAHGRVRSSLPFGTMGALDTTLPGALPPTPFVRWGEIPVLVLLAGLSLLTLRRKPRPMA
ncbi:MAG: apolipoprotein N-acyltransferase [Pseudomonadota bacterium]